MGLANLRNYVLVYWKRRRPCTRRASCTATSGAASCFIRHRRDASLAQVKPSNIAIDVTDEGYMQVTLLDFSSAWSSEAESAGLYGSTGPTRDEETVEYMPPERLLDDSAKTPSPAQDGSVLPVPYLYVSAGLAA